MNGTAIKRLKVGRPYTQRTAPLMVPGLFWVTGVLGMLVGFWRLWAVRRWVLLGTVGGGPVIASVHCFTLAGLTMVMMGALYQLMPVLLNCEPVAAKHAAGQWVLYTLGLIFFISGLNSGDEWALALGGSGILVGIGYFLLNMATRIRYRSTWNITAWFFATALVYLALTLVMGGLLVLRYSTGAPSFAEELAVHMTVALGGWFGFLVVGASYRLWAMFGRRHHEPKYWLGTWTLLNLAVIGIVLGDILVAPWVTDVGWGFQAAAFLVYVADIGLGGLFDRRTMQDPALRTIGASLIFLAVWEVLGTLALGRHHDTLWIPALLAYGLGWVGISFLGFVQKILPFMVWLHRYAHVRGQGKTPRLEDIWRPFWAYGPLGGAASGLAILLGAWGLDSQLLFNLGVALQTLAWLLLLVMGIKAVRGPHHRSN